MLKKNKKNIIGIFIGMVVLLVIIIMAIVFRNKETDIKNEPPVSTENPTEMPEESEIQEDDALDTTFTEEYSNTIKEYMNQFNEVRIMRSLAKDRFTFSDKYENGIHREHESLEYVVSTINLKNYTDVTVYTEDYWKDDFSNLLDFEETFGFDYKDYDNIYDVIIAAANAGGFPVEFINTKWNQAALDFGQTVFDMSEESPINTKMLNEIKQDKNNILDRQYNTFRLINNGCWHSAYIYDITSAIIYNNNNSQNKYIAQLEIYIPGSDAELCNCGCSDAFDSKEDCNCTDEEPNYE